MWVPVLVAAVLVVQQHLDGLDKLLGDGVQQGVLRVHPVIDEQLHHLQVLVIDGHQQGGPAERIDAVDVDVTLRFGLLQDSTRKVSQKEERSRLNKMTEGRKRSNSCKVVHQLHTPRVKSSLFKGLRLFDFSRKDDPGQLTASCWPHRPAPPPAGTSSPPARGPQSPGVVGPRFPPPSCRGCCVSEFAKMRKKKKKIKEIKSHTRDVSKPSRKRNICNRAYVDDDADAAAGPIM